MIAYLNFLVVFTSNTVVSPLVSAIGLFFFHSFTKSSTSVGWVISVNVSVWLSVAVASRLPPEMFTAVAQVSPLSPNALIFPPEMLMAVSACIASLPHLMDMSPPSISTLPLEDLIPSPSPSMVIVPPFTVTDFLPLIASFLFSASSVLIVMIPPVSFISLLQTIAV